MCSVYWYDFKASEVTSDALLSLVGVPVDFDVSVCRIGVSVVCSVGVGSGWVSHDPMVSFVEGEWFGVTCTICCYYGSVVETSSL